jgi:RNA-splicing ligase RtcB
MRVPGRIYATEKMLEHIAGDNCLEQVANVAFLPGIRRLRPIGAVKASRGRMS